VRHQSKFSTVLITKLRGLELTNLYCPEGGGVGPRDPGAWDMGDALEPAAEAFYMKD
jgi:hypothetical protein